MSQYLGFKQLLRSVLELKQFLEKLVCALKQHLQYVPAVVFKWLLQKTVVSVSVLGCSFVS